MNKYLLGTIVGLTGYKSPAMKTKNLNNPANRQKFLKDSVNRNLLLTRLKKAQEEAERSHLISEAKMIGKMIRFMEEGSDIEFKELRRAFRLRKLHLS